MKTAGPGEHMIEPPLFRRSVATPGTEVRTRKKGAGGEEEWGKETGTTRGALTERGERDINTKKETSLKQLHRRIQGKTRHQQDRTGLSKKKDQDSRETSTRGILQKQTRRDERKSTRAKKNQARKH
ncbi:hypothetical protein NDU88_000061 [Pleurodeles waltl]|uniref:Uncharacterized protein n=1 Tax=Pleurodeles waltl TaxID=8319 RepID=A0AAV7Q4J4_PLEWA|nr:hypothetical protein NDU88_000061 [Pleurodeles waltl]